MVVPWRVVRWHPTQLVGVPAYLPPTWHRAQATCRCAPVRAKRVLAWLKVDGLQAVVLWHVVQVCGKPALTWFGLVVLWKVVRWHPTQSVEVPAYRPPTWHCEQLTCACAPVNLNWVLPWSKTAPFQRAVV